MHAHMSLQDFVIMIFSIGTPFCICCYCSMRCLNSYLEARKNAAIENIYISDTESDSDNETHELEDIENILLSPRSIRVINKYGHFKPYYSSDSEYTSESDYTSEDDTEITHEREVPQIPRAYG